jgi:hypothetical protein
MAQAATPVLDQVRFDDFASLFDAAELRDVIEEWRVDSATALDAIAVARARDDHTAIGELAHRAGGGGLALGATAFAHACEHLRKTAASGGPVTDPDVAAVRAAVDAAHAAMSNAANSAPQAQPKNP